MAVATWQMLSSFDGEGRCAVRGIETCDRCSRETKTVKLFRWKLWSSLIGCHNCGRQYCSQCILEIENQCDACGHTPVERRDDIPIGPWM